MRFSVRTTTGDLTTGRSKLGSDPQRWMNWRPATPELKRDIAPTLQANTKLVLDLSRPRFVDSSGLGASAPALWQRPLPGGGAEMGATEGAHEEGL
jgi:hypothetical protein